MGLVLNSHFTLRENTKNLKYNGLQVRSGGTGGVQQSPGPNKQRQRTRTSNAGQEGQSKIKNSGNPASL